MYHLATLLSRRSSAPLHIVNPWGRAWYSGMTAKALCGAKVNVLEEKALVGIGYPTAPAGTCARCAASVGQKVRAA